MQSLTYSSVITPVLHYKNQVNYTVQKAWKALHFIMRVLKRGNSNMKSLVYMSQVRPILEYGAAWWDTYRGGRINALDREQKKEAKL
jgi:hypothetical protein